ncbi:hypothetical protein DL767_005440 [Monosporascus sp. MG133]|nr:hypothetical protein DL767_005440 [Monosporascus sp. MG133]
MRLLERDNAGRIRLTEDLPIDNIPPYAILSHTWGAEEVLFSDMIGTRGHNKAGYVKIRFCGDQAWRDGLKFFWVDTCCIDKSSSTELQEAINSMFRWYRDATKCYAYLADVSTPTFNADDKSSWEPAFQASRWFTRGWTLQELIAPKLVEFFSRENVRLGDKKSLEQQIHNVTGIPISALQGSPLSGFSIPDRMAWVEKRKTTRKEDKAYSLLGIFDIYMPLIYGEGEKNAFRRLQEEVSKASKSEQTYDEVDARCLADLRSTDPRDDKIRIEQTKGGLLRDAYKWVLDNAEFQRWRHEEHSRLLWIKGDPGKGKTMLLCGIIDELKGSIGDTALLSFFFCQATDQRINSATAVLRGLIYLLAKQQPSLVPRIRERYNDGGKQLFEGANAWVTLSQIFTSILEDPNLQSTFLIVDALDECVTDISLLLDFIVAKSPMLSRVKWIVSSRNWPNIKEQMDLATQKVRLCLELNEDSIYTAVDIYIQNKVDQLAKLKKYDDKTRDAVHGHLSSNANDTFLWVSLVYQIHDSDEADLCKQTLVTMSTVYRPITVTELTTFVETLEDLSDDYEALEEIVGLCGSFLTLRDRAVYFVHQSAKDFLLKKAFDQISSFNIQRLHYTMFSVSLRTMSKALRRDVYALRHPGYPIDKVEPPDPDPLATIRYACVYWVDHLRDCDPTNNAVDDLQDGGSVAQFLASKYLYWLEALSLLRSMSEGIASMLRLKGLLQVGFLLAWSHETGEAVRLASGSHDNTVKIWEPATGRCISTLKGHTGWVKSVTWSYDTGEAAWLASSSMDNIIKIWNPTTGRCISVLKGHTGAVNSISWSHSSGKAARLASVSNDRTIRIWNPATGKCISTLSGRIGGDGYGYIVSVAWSYDLGEEARLASSSDNTVKIWDPAAGCCISKLRGHTHSVESIAWSCDIGKAARLASASRDTVKIWKPATGLCIATLKSHNIGLWSVSWSYEPGEMARVATASGDRTIKIWNPATGNCISTLNGHTGSVHGVAWSHDIGEEARLASSSDNAIKIWDPAAGRYNSKLRGHTNRVRSIAWPHNTGKAVWFASASDDYTVKIWELTTGLCIATLEGHTKFIRSISWSYEPGEMARVASASEDMTVKIWEPATGCCVATLDGHTAPVYAVAWSHDPGKTARLASASLDQTLKIWDPATGCCIATLNSHSPYTYEVAWSHETGEAARLASASMSTVRVWNPATSHCILTFDGHNSHTISSLAWSYEVGEAAQLASASYDYTVKIWDAATGRCLATLNVDQVVESLRFHKSILYRLYTNVGTFDVRPTVSSTVVTAAIPKVPTATPQPIGFGLNSNSHLEAMELVEHRDAEEMSLAPELSDEEASVRTLILLGIVGLVRQARPTDAS